MRKVLISTRADYLPDRGETRDSLDRALSEYVSDLGFLPFLIPNIKTPEVINQYVKSIQPEAIILSGGNDIDPSLYGEAKDASANYSAERDGIERIVLKVAIEQNLKLIGICRGMQMLNVFFGGKLKRLERSESGRSAHVGTPHGITFLKSDPASGLDSGLEWTVNSFHDWGFTPEETAQTLDVLAISKDGIVEMVRHKRHPFLGMMWHPERGGSDKQLDTLLISRFLGGGQDEY